MASLMRFTVNHAKLVEKIQVLHDLAESSRRLHFVAACKIQAWFRGIITRNHLRMLHECATIVQRHWRGYYTRRNVDQYLVEYTHRMWRNHCNRMATKIQAAWRGYWTRKTQVDFVQLQRWLKSVYAKNDEILENMRRFRQKELEQAESAVEQDSMMWILYILFKLHHLLGTKCRPGVITRIDKTRFTHIEEMFKCLEYCQYISKARTAYKDCRSDYKSSLISRDAYFEKCRKEIREFEKSLKARSLSIFKNTV